MWWTDEDEPLADRTDDRASTVLALALFALLAAGLALADGQWSPKPVSERDLPAMPR